MSKLIRLKNKQLEKLKGELDYPAHLDGMMVNLLNCMQTFLKKEMSDNDWTSNVMLGGLVLLVIVAVFFISKTIRLLNKQDYYALKKLTNLPMIGRSEEHTSELQSRFDLVCRLLLEKKKQTDSAT